MVEPLPVIEKDKLLFISSSADISRVINADSGYTRWFLWHNVTAYDISKFVKDNVFQFNGYKLSLNNWFEPTPWVYGRIVTDLEEYVDFLYKSIGDKISGKKLLLSYSGGKDSTASLLILLKLLEKIDFKLHVLYVYMPYLEPQYNIRFIENVSKRLNVEIHMINPPRDIMKKYLLKEGLPYRRGRWCTYLKTRPIRDYVKKHGIDILVIGDRLWEATKRLYRLLPRVLSKIMLQGKKLYIIAPLTLLDVINIVKEHNIVHPDYLHGAIRVSCYYCPYKSIFELNLLKPDVEDHGFIEEVIKYEWIKWYRKNISLEDFIENHLWRFIPSVAKLFLKAKEKAKQISDKTISLKDIVYYNTYVWRNEIKAPVLNYDQLSKHILSNTI